MNSLGNFFVDVGNYSSECAAIFFNTECHA